MQELTFAITRIRVFLSVICLRSITAIGGVFFCCRIIYIYTGAALRVRGF